VEGGDEAPRALSLSPELLPWLVYAALGVFVGFFAGLLGIGGGSMIVPVVGLTLVAFDFTPERVLHLSLGTSLAAMIVSTASSIYEHHRHEAVRWDLVKGLAPGITVAALAAGFIARATPVPILKFFFLCFMLYVAGQVIFGRKPRPGRGVPGPLATTAVGLGIGGLSALAGVGGAMLSVPYMMYCNVNLRHAIASSAAISFVVSVTGAVGFVAAGLREPGLPEWTLGYVYLPAFLGISLTSIFFAPLGAKLVHRMPVETLKKIFVLFLLVLAGKLVYSL
jgi:uncharacterized protein